MRLFYFAVLLALGTSSPARAQVTLGPGDILVTEEVGLIDEEFGTVLEPPGIIRVNPVTGAQDMFASGPPLVNPLGVAIENSGDLIVTDGFAGNSVLRINRATGAISLLSTGAPYLGDPSGVAIAIDTNGDIYVADFGPDAIIRIDPVTGAQTLVSIGGMFVFPTGLAFEADGNLIVVDRDADGGTGAVIRVNPGTGAQTLVSSAGFLNEPTWAAIEADGNIVLTERQTLGGAVIRVNPVTGAQTVVSSGDNFRQAAGITVDGDGDILVTDFIARAVIRVNPTTGAQTVVSADGLFRVPVGVAVILCHSDAECSNGNSCTIASCAPGTSGANAFGCVYTTAAEGAVCRPAAGACDAPETCDGGTCPPDLKRTDVCRPSSGSCDVAESCNGVSDACPADNYVAASTTCRPAGGACDSAESCTGSSPYCPSDDKKTTVCRPAAGPCDEAESCDGTGDACPSDRFKSGETVCRGSLGVCDPTEYCSGYAANCPYDAKSTAVCRPSVGSCDPAESCDGVGANCPSNAYAATGASCASDGNECTRDRCDGAGTCTHPNELNNTVCRDDGASCTDDVCYADAGQVSACVHRPNDARCDTDRDACTIDRCDPARSTLVSGCTLGGFKAAGTGCDDHNTCTSGDKCTTTEGTATACSAGKLATGIVDCDGNLCTVGDYCSSTTKACVPGTRLMPVGTFCDDGNACSAPDQCTSTGRCVGPGLPDGQICDDRNCCTGPDRCLVGVCTSITLPDGTACDDGNRCTLDWGDKCSRGTCAGGPKKDCSTSTLFSPRCQPSTGFCCGKISQKGSTVVCR